MSEPSFPLHWPQGWPRKTGPTGGDVWSMLGLPPTAGADEVMATYREKAKKMHPDMEGGSHEAFAALSQAKDIALATIETRRRGS